MDGVFFQSMNPPLPGRQPAPPGVAWRSVATGRTDTVTFGNHHPHVEKQWLAAANRALNALRRIRTEGRTLRPGDESWLKPLREQFGVNSRSIHHPDDPAVELFFRSPLTVSEINRNPARHLAALEATLRTMVFATLYRPKQVQLGSYSLPVHNRELALRLKSAYTPKAFNKLFSLCLEKGTFNLKIDPGTGLVKTADIDNAEDHVMVQGWVTDTVRNGDRQKDQDPASWVKALETLARFYANQQPEFDRLIENPPLYRKDARRAGIPHIFDPDTFQTFDWLNPKRLESHGLALKAFCEAVVDGSKGKPTGFAQTPDAVAGSIANLAKFLAVIDYSNAPSIGPWEEVIFDGLSWDTEAIRSGFQALSDLMFNPAYDENAAIRKVRRQLAAHRYGGLLTDKPALDRLIRAGETQLKQRLLSEIPAEHPDRPADAALAFITTSDLRLKDAVTDDVSAQLRILAFMEQTVVGENGLKRYPPFAFAVNGQTVTTTDGYLMPNWGLEAADAHGNLMLGLDRFEAEFGYPLSHLEPSTNAAFHARAKNGVTGKEAQWFMIAQMARGYGEQLAKLLDVLAAENRPPTRKERRLMRQAYEKQTEYVNRSYARITGEGLLKANGRPCPAWKVPEAYQHVSAFLPEDESQPDSRCRKTVMLPGVNTPLAWGASSLYAASKLFAKNLERLDRLGLLSSLN